MIRRVVFNLLVLAAVCLVWISIQGDGSAQAIFSGQGSYAGEELIFSDGFTPGSSTQWLVPFGWSTAQESGDTYLHATSAGMASPLAALVRSQYRLQADLRLGQGSAQIWFRQSYDHVYGYRLEVASGGLQLYRELGDESTLSLAADPTSISTHAWHTLEISATLGHLQVSIDDQLRLDTLDADPWYAGGIALEVRGATVAVDFDDIQVWAPEDSEPAWVQSGGPDGGYFGTVEINPANPNIVYAAGSGGGVFKSSDGGQTWGMLAAITRPGDAIADLILSPDNPQLLYARSTSGELSKSSDGGVVWARTDQPEAFDCCLAIDPLHPTYLLGRGAGKLYLSTNRGTGWTDVSGDLPPGEKIAAIAITGPQSYWAGSTTGNGGAVYHTVDGGIHWQKQIQIGQDASLNAAYFFVDPDDALILYTGFSGSYATPPGLVLPHLFKTIDGGLSWDPVPTPFTGGVPRILAKSPSDGVLFMSLPPNLYHSDDQGQTWDPLSVPFFTVDPYDLAVHPADSQLLFLPPRSSGLYLSRDGGDSWSEIRQGLRNTDVIHLAVPSRPGSRLIYSGNYVSANSGASWTYIIKNGIDHPFIDDVLVSPFDPRAAWVAVDNGTTFTTTDQGAHWTKSISVADGYGFRFGSIYAAAVAPSEDERLYVLRNGLGIFSSAAAGNGWTYLNTSGVDYSYSLAVHPQDANIVYSGYTPKPFQDWAYVRRTVDAGLTWTTTLSVTHSSGITSVAIDPSQPEQVYAGSTGKAGVGGQIYVTQNGGASWDRLNPHFTLLTVWGQPQLIVAPDNPDVVYAATWLGGTWKSSNAGQDWTLLEAAPQSSTALSQGYPDVIYSADRTRPVVWKSMDFGQTWHVAADFSASGAFLLNRVFAMGDTVYAATFGPGIHGGKLYRSKNGGKDWSDISGSLPRSVLDMAVDPQNEQIIYATTHIHGAYKSVDGGLSWNEMADFPDIGGYDIEVDPLAPNILYAAGMGAATVPDWVMPPSGYTLSDPSGVYRSGDGGLHWTPILTTTNECRAVRLHPDHANWIFAVALDEGLLVSTDGGAHWTQNNAGLDTLNLTSLAVRADKIYAGTQGMGVYAGDLDLGTGAVSWQARRSNKPVPAVYNLKIEVDPENSKRIYVGANPGGLFRSDDGGQTWEDKNFLTPSVIVDDPYRQGYYPFALNPQDSDDVWLGTWGKGIYKSYDGMDFNIGANGADRVMLGKHINAILIDAHYGVLAASEEGVWLSTDGGDTWDDFSAGLDSPQVRTLNANKMGRLFAGTTGYEMYTRAPGDAQWMQLPALDHWGELWPIWDNRPNYQFTSFLFHPTDPKIIYAGTFPAGVFKSTDGGQSWLESNTGFTFDGIFYLVNRPGDPEVIYAGTYNGVNYTLDGGAHWQRRDHGWPGEQWVYSIDFDPRDPRVMVACSLNGENMGRGRPGFHGTVMKTTDGGQNWFPITRGLNVNQEFYEIIIDKKAPDTYYLATQAEGVFISRDGGDLWLPYSAGLTNLQAATNGNFVSSPMTLSPEGRYLYFGSAGSGAFRRTVRTNFPIYLPLIR